MTDNKHDKKAQDAVADGMMDGLFESKKKPETKATTYRDPYYSGGSSYRSGWSSRTGYDDWERPVNRSNPYGRPYRPAEEEDIPAFLDRRGPAREQTGGTSLSKQTPSYARPGERTTAAADYKVVSGKVELNDEQVEAIVKKVFASMADTFEDHRLIWLSTAALAFKDMLRDQLRRGNFMLRHDGTLFPMVVSGDDTVPPVE